MKIEKALKFINEAERRKADIQVDGNIWEYTENPNEAWDDENKLDFAYDLCNWKAQCYYIAMILPNGEKIPLRGQ